MTMRRPVSPEHVAEMRRRAERRFAEAREALGARNMNDTKLEVTGDGAEAVEASLKSLGALPLQPVDGGFRLQA